MRPTSVTNNAVEISTPIVVDMYQFPNGVGFSVIVSDVSTSKVQYTLDDPWAVYATDYNTDANWLDAPTPWDSISTSTGGVLSTPARAIRLNTTAWTSGTAIMTVAQAGLMA